MGLIFGEPEPAQHQADEVRPPASLAAGIVDAVAVVEGDAVAMGVPVHRATDSATGAALTAEVAALREMLTMMRAEPTCSRNAVG